MTKLTPETKKKLRSRSRLVHLGRDSEATHGFVNFPAYRGSTVLFPDVETMKSRNQRYTYGTHGTPTTDALCEAWSELSGAAGTVLVPSGLFAIIGALMTALSSGDHLLMTDAAYQPARIYCDTILKRMGVETTYYDPAVGGGIGALMRANTRAIFVEAPGSQSLDMQDVPAIAAVARERGVCLIMRMGSIWRWRPARNIFPAIRTSSLASSRPMPPGRRALAERSTRWPFSPVPRTSILPCAACAPWSCACANPNDRRSPSPIGFKRAKK
jgi:O-acetylhomoserine/O-acetylserine sulfhydrylase-like pyridoxal-dependent enzyme